MGSAARRLPGPVGRAVAGILSDELESQGLTQAHLGRLANLSQSQVSNYLRGMRGITIDEADDICRALGLNLVEVLTEASR